MRRITSMILCLMLMFTSTPAFAGEMTEADSPESKKKIVILATGGTIAGVGDSVKEDGYKPGTLAVDDLLSEIPGLADLAEYEAIQICNVNSDDITDEIWIQLANTINEMAADPEVDGFFLCGCRP